MWSSTSALVAPPQRITRLVAPPLAALHQPLITDSRALLTHTLHTLNANYCSGDERALGGGDEGSHALTDSEPIVISPATVRQKADEVAALERRVAAAREELSHLVAFLKAAGRADWIPDNLIIVSAAANQRAVLPGKARAEHGTWTSEIRHILDKAPNGMTFEHIKLALEETPLADRLTSNPNGFYNGVSILEKRGEAAKYKGRVFTVPLLDAFKERVRAGEIEDLSGKEGAITVSEAAVELINQHPNGIKARDLTEALVRAKAAPSAGSVYNVLSKLATRGRVRRSEGVYYPLKENGPPEGGPDTGEAGTSPIENRDHRQLDLG